MPPGQLAGSLASPSNHDSRGGREAWQRAGTEQAVSFTTRVPTDAVAYGAWAHDARRSRRVIPGTS
jgi:hypothetical protein